jgi:hypothetical protein
VFGDAPVGVDLHVDGGDHRAHDDRDDHREGHPVVEEAEEHRVGAAGRALVQGDAPIHDRQSHGGAFLRRKPPQEGVGLDVRLVEGVVREGPVDEELAVVEAPLHGVGEAVLVAVAGVVGDAEVARASCSSLPA